jgi:hypothetical protein
MRIRIAFADSELDELIANLCRCGAAAKRNGHRVPISQAMLIGRLTRNLESARRAQLDLIPLTLFETEVTEIEAVLLLMAATLEKAPDPTALIQKTAETCWMLAGKLGDARRSAHEAKAERRWW